MITNIKYILLTALRDWLFVALLFGVSLATAISIAMGGTALLEPEQMTLAFSAASARAILMIGLIVFVCFHIRSGFDTKEIDVMLSRPISRGNLVLSFWLGFSIVAILVVVPIIAIIGYVGLMSINGFALWSVSLLLEALLVVALSLFASLTLRSAVFSVLASLGFYVLSRMMGFFVATSESGVLFENQEVNTLLRGAIDIVSVVVPRLDFFTKSEWLIYGIRSYDEIQLFLIQTAVFVPLLIVAAIIDFKRRQF